MHERAKRLRRLTVPVLVLGCGLGLTVEAQTKGPQPGEVYREYSTHNGRDDWRVTDPKATPERAREKLPNPVLNIAIDDLEGAARAEALLDRWGGHIRTTDKRIRFNGNDWLTVPELTTTPGGERAEYYFSQDNPLIEVPVSHLRKGMNTFEGTCGAVEGFGWGQWGLYSLMVRVYYDPDKKGHVRGEIVYPAAGGTIGENPTIRVACSRGTARVDLLAWYEGYDEDGDGLFLDWHGSYHQPLRGSPAGLRDHVGTMWRAPYEFVWDTRWVPDQDPGAVKLVARIQGANGIWFVTDPVVNLTIERQDRVVWYRPTDVPEQFGVRMGKTKSCRIPMREAARLDRAVEAVLALRTWHGWDEHHDPLELNGYRFPIDGKNHHYDFDLLPVPTRILKRGDNVFRVHSQTEHPTLEVLWPGPALIVRYDRKGEEP